MKKIIWLIETILLYIFSYIIPKKDNLILFWSMKWKYIWWNPKIFYLYINEFHKNKYDIRFFDWNNTNIDNRIKVYWFWLKKYFLILRAKYLIFDTHSSDLWIKWIIIWKYNNIQLWHWEPIKKILFLSNLLKDKWFFRYIFDILEIKSYKIILSNIWSIKTFKKAFKSDNIYWFWFPRNDFLINKDILLLNENIVVKNYINNLKQNLKKIILLAPTFREKNNSKYFNENQLNLINNILKEKKYVILIKKHISEKREFLWNKKYSNIIDISVDLNYDSTDFLPFIDLVITDYSSIYIDFLLTWKPVIFYQNDLDDYINIERWLLYNPEDIIIKETTAYSFEEFLNILNYIEEIVKNNEYNKSYIKLYDLFYKGLDTRITSCERLYSLLFKK